MKIIVTGATGFVGREIISELSQNGYELYSVGNSAVNQEIVDQRTFKIDITNNDQVKKLEELGMVDVVVHSAGLAHQFGDVSREQFQKTNFEGTKNILALAVNLKVKHFILISSTAIYGTWRKIGSEVKIIDEMTICRPPKTFYAESKLQAEQAAIEICERNKINLTIFRLAPVIGEGNSGNVARMIEAIERKRFIWIGSGKNYKSLIYKRDVARACRQIIARKKEKTEIFNLAAEPILMKEFVAEAALQLKRKIPGISISPSLLSKIFKLNEITLNLRKVSKIAVTVEKWLSDDVYSSKKFEREYNFKSETSITDALQRQIVCWQQSQKRR